MNINPDWMRKLGGEMFLLNRPLDNQNQKVWFQICLLIPSRAGRRPNWWRPKGPAIGRPLPKLVAKKSTNLWADGDDDDDDDTYRTLPALHQPLT